MPGREDISPQRHFRDWLRTFRFTGCAFAAQFGGSAGGLLYWELLDDVELLDPAEVEQFIDKAAEQHRVGVIIGSRMRGDDDTAKLLRVLSRHPRWRVDAPSELTSDEAGVGVQMTWRTVAELATDAMGFAPSGFMPMSRRAPYVALAIWSGGHENPARTRSDPARVGMGDAPPPNLGEYGVTMERTRTRSGDLAGLEPLPPRQLRRLAFRLERRSLERNFPELRLPTWGRTPTPASSASADTLT